MKAFLSTLFTLLLTVAVLSATFVTASAQALSSTSETDALAFDIETEVRWFGRTYAKGNAHFFNWSASGFEFRFKGSGVSATFNSIASNSNHTAYIKIYVDGVEQPDVPLKRIGQKVTLASDLDPNQIHTVKVVKRTNARSSPASLTSLTLTDGKKMAPPTTPTRLIEFIGDSITVGYATVANGATTWSTSTEDATKTYAEQIAKAFGADYMVTAISGRGVVRNSGGDTDKLLPAIYGKLDEYNNPGVEYDFARQPDVIVINLGTNDASSSNSDLTSAAFREGLKAFLLDVRAKNPDAFIIYGYGMMRTKFSEDMQQVIAELVAAGDTKLAYVELKNCTTAERALNHPTKLAYVSRGKVLISQIEKMTGWKEGDIPELAPPLDETEEETDEITVAEETTAAITTDDKTAKKGCGASLGGVALPFSLAISTVGMILSKKKKRL